jgi:hypothetical protein
MLSISHSGLVSNLMLALQYLFDLGADPKNIGIVSVDENDEFDYIFDI